ncbi:hypothetical protein ES708_10654 [subsurface metagenome]
MEIIDLGIEGLKKMKGIGDIYAKKIFNRAIEEIQDTQSALQILF